MREVNSRDSAFTMLITNEIFQKTRSSSMAPKAVSLVTFTARMTGRALVIRVFSASVCATRIYVLLSVLLESFPRTCLMSMVLGRAILMLRYQVNVNQKEINFVRIFKSMFYLKHPGHLWWAQGEDESGEELQEPRLRPSQEHLLIPCEAQDPFLTSLPLHIVNHNQLFQAYLRAF